MEHEESGTRTSTESVRRTVTLDADDGLTFRLSTDFIQSISIVRADEQTVVAINASA